MALAAEDLHGFVLIRDSIAADSSCVVSDVFKLVLGPGQPPGSVLVVSTQHSTSHYSTMLRRLNLNVTKIASEGRFKVLHALRFGQVDSQGDLFALDRKPLMDAIAQDLSSLSGSSVLLFDDVVSLVSVCHTSPMDIGVEKTLIGLGSSVGARCTVMVAHGDVPDYARAMQALGHLASSLVTVKPLESGTSAEIESQIHVFRRRCSPIASGNVALGYSEQITKR